MIQFICFIIAKICISKHTHFITQFQKQLISDYFRIEYFQMKLIPIQYNPQLSSNKLIFIFLSISLIIVFIVKLLKICFKNSSLSPPLIRCDKDFFLYKDWKILLKTK